ncbi:hypothetical protein BU17DRAFT_103621 [Hysterangium stoloniferum]|nr:hypothetical protein BU17DRAFT_103621 [Hysterangium stoloniferum]
MHFFLGGLYTASAQCVATASTAPITTVSSPTSPPPAPVAPRTPSPASTSSLNLSPAIILGTHKGLEALAEFIAASNAFRKTSAPLFSLAPSSVLPTPGSFCILPAFPHPSVDPPAPPQPATSIPFSSLPTFRAPFPLVNYPAMNDLIDRSYLKAGSGDDLDEM